MNETVKTFSQGILLGVLFIGLVAPISYELRPKHPIITDEPTPGQHFANFISDCQATIQPWRCEMLWKHGWSIPTTAQDSIALPPGVLAGLEDASNPPLPKKSKPKTTLTEK